MSINLKIGIVVDQLLAGGVQLAAIEQVKELVRLGYKAKLLILMRKKYPTDFSYLVHGIPYEYLSDSYPPFTRNTIKFPIFSFLSTLHLASPFLAPTVIKKGSYDILVSWGTTTCLTTQAIYKKQGIPYIAVIHDPINYILDKVYSRTYLRWGFPILKKIARHFEASFVKDAEKTVVISKVHEAYIKTNYGVDPEVIHLGVRTTKKPPKNLGDSILSFGRWQKEKGPDFLLSLIEKIPGSKLIIAGSWTDKGDLVLFRNKIKKNGLGPRVHVIPSYNEEGLLRISKQARLFVHPHFESFGLAALEAASFGLPIIIPRKSGVTERFKHGVHGYFPKKVNVGEFKKYILPLLKSEKLAKRLGANAQKVVQKEFSWSKNVKHFLSLVKASGLSKKPEIVVVECGHAMDAPLAGGDKVMEPMAKRLSEKYDFSVIVPAVGAKHWLNAGFRKSLAVLPENPFDLKGKPVPVFLSYLVRMWQTSRILASIPAPYVLYSSTNILPDVLPAYFTRKTSIRWVARVHHLIPSPLKREGSLVVNTVSFLMQTLSLAMIKHRADLVIALNENLKKQLTLKGFDGKKLKVLGAGIDTVRIARTGNKRNKTYDAVFVGRFHSTKGIFDLVPIWKRVVAKLPKAKLAIVGGGQQDIIEHLKNDIAKEKLSANIKLLGYLPDLGLYRTLKEAKIFLFTDHEAGWGIAVAEAMAAGIPVIGYDIGILGSVYKMGFRKVRPGSFDSFANEAVSLISSPKTLGRLSREALFESSRHNWQKTTLRFAGFLDKL